MTKRICWAEGCNKERPEKSFYCKEHLNKAKKGEVKTSVPRPVGVGKPYQDWNQTTN